MGKFLKILVTLFIMKYIHTYDINRKIHVRPFREIVEIVAELYKEYESLDILLKEPKTGNEINCESIIRLITRGLPFYKGGKVEIIIKGEYSLKILKECADRIGNIFSFKDDSETLLERLYKKYKRNY